jgi:acyl-CoA dehydrogenase
MAGLATTDEMFDLRMSEGAKPLFDRVKTFIAEEVEPHTIEFFRLGEKREDRWSWASGQLELLDGLKGKAKANGLWNFFLPDDETGQGLENLDYAYIAAELGKNPIASECLNCSAPDTGNMEVLERAGTPEQKARWLKPLLDGEIRSAYAMTEPELASSDAKNIACRARLHGDEWVIDGEKTPPTVTCTCASPTAACPGRTSSSARDAASRSRRSAWDRDGSITACGRSAPRSGPSN